MYWIAAVIIAGSGAAKALFSIAAALLTDVDDFRSWYALANVVWYPAVGGVLAILGRQDRRAVTLGIYFILIGTAWSDRLLFHLANESVSSAAWASFFIQLQVVAFTPFFFWNFVRDFPNRIAFDTHGRVVDLTIAATFLLSTLCLVANLAPIPTNMAVWLDRTTPGSLFWPIIYLATFPAIAYAVRQARHARADERRRVRIMLASLVLGFTPELIIMLASAASPSFDRLTNPDTAPIMYVIIGVPMMAVPFGVAYAVLVHKALDLRLIVRKAVHYGFARISILGFLVLPFVVAVIATYRQRNQSIVDVVAGPSGILMVSVLLVGIMLARSRTQFLAAVDRRFFREQYNAHEILASLVRRGRSMDDLREIATVIPSEIDRALHLHSATLLVSDYAPGTLASPIGAAPPLPATAQLLRELQNADGVLRVDPDADAGWISKLPADERQWLSINDPRLLIEVPGRGGSLEGVLVLGEKRSELPYSRDDKELLRAVGDAVALALAHTNVHALKSVGLPSSPADSPVQECTACGLIAQPDAEQCSACGSAVSPSILPQLLAGKYRPMRRIGRGGMGVVYQAFDETLRREVAIKTLPVPASQLALRIRREARAMAAVTHPNLGAIYGVESRNNVPLLVVELLKGGTLEDRLRGGRLSVRDALNITTRVARGIECLHNAGILHRDIKPSNIAFALDGTPKMVDFGLVGIQESSGATVDSTTLQHHADIRTELTKTGMLVGTLPYLSPEVLDGLPPTPAVDLWALSLVAYESIAGQHPFGSGTQLQLLYRISNADVPDIRDFAPEATASVAAFFARCFDRAIEARPQTAREWRKAAEGIRRSLSEVNR